MTKFGIFFEWDEAKARANFAKHRISFENASERRQYEKGI